MPNCSRFHIQSAAQGRVWPRETEPYPVLAPGALSVSTWGCSLSIGSLHNSLSILDEYNLCLSLYLLMIEEMKPVTLGIQLEEASEIFT